MTQEIRAELLPYDQTSGLEHALNLVEHSKETQLSFLAEVPHPYDEEAALLLRGTIDHQEKMVHLFNGDVQPGLSFQIGTDHANLVLSHITHTPLPEIEQIRNGEFDPRTPERKHHERNVREHLPFNLHDAIERVTNPEGTENPEMVTFLKLNLFRETAKQVKRYADAEGKKAQLMETKPHAAAKIATFDTDIAKLEESAPDVALSLRALSFGNRERLIQLVGEYKSLEKLKQEKEKIIEVASRGAGEYHMLNKKGLTKASLVAHIFPEITDPAIILDEKALQQARNSVSKAFWKTAEQYAAATKLTNEQLAEMGRNVFSMDLYNEAVTVQNKAVEVTRNNKESLVGYDYSSLQLTTDGQRLVDPQAETIEGMPFSYWQEMPIVPLFMKNDKFQEVSSANTAEEAALINAHNILTIFDSAQVSSHGKQTTNRADIAQHIQQAILEDRPIQVEYFYNLGRMANPLSAGQNRMPGLQDLSFLYKLGQIAETAKLFYQPSNEQPALQWVHVNEFNAFRAIGDQDTQENKMFRKELDTMVTKMGLSNIILSDDLQSWIDKDPENVLPVIEKNYARISTAIATMENSGLEVEEYIQSHKNELDKQIVEDLLFMRDIHTSQMKLINPALQYPNISAQDLIRAYEGIMPTVEQQPEPLTPTQKEVREYTHEHALAAYIYFRSVMLSRTAMKPTYIPDFKVSITDKGGKYGLHTGDPRTDTFPSNGVGVIRYTQTSNFGATEVSKPWYDVLRAVTVYAQREKRDGEITNQRRYVGIVDPTAPSRIPYAYLEKPYIVEDEQV